MSRLRRLFWSPFSFLPPFLIVVAKVFLEGKRRLGEAAPHFSGRVYEKGFVTCLLGAFDRELEGVECGHKFCPFLWYLVQCCMPRAHFLQDYDQQTSSLL